MEQKYASSYSSTMSNGGREDTRLAAHARRRRGLASPAIPAALVAVAAASGVLAVAAPSSAASAAARGGAGPWSRAARTLNVTDTAHLRYRGTSGSSLIEEGVATGGLPGRVRVRFDVGASVAASFTISTPHGALIGHGKGLLHASGMYASFGGSMVVTRGTGRFRHAHGRGGFYGVINRKTYDVTVQTISRLSY
jgi:hypothetical protein